MSLELSNFIFPLLILAVLILLLSEYFRARRKRYLEEGTLTEGEVVNVRTTYGKPKTESKPATEDRHYYKVAYLDQHGVRHHLRFDEEGYQKYGRGDLLPIRYLPNMPADGKLSRPGDMMVPQIACYFGALIIVLFVGAILTLNYLSHR